MSNRNISILLHIKFNNLNGIIVHMIMKQKCIIFFLFFIFNQINAQYYDCFNPDNNWDYAFGVTLFSNKTYPPRFSNDFHPLEFDFKYKLSKQNILRASIPLIWKRNILGSPEVPYVLNKTTTIEQYLADLHSIDKAGYYDPINVVENYTSIIGLTLGYEHNIPLVKKIKFLLGFDFGYTYQYTHVRYFSLHYNHLNANNQTTLYQISDKTIDHNDNIFNIYPFIGIRYKLQEFMLEANIGYNFSLNLANRTYLETNADINNIIRKASPFYANWSQYYNKFNYKLSLFYTFNY